MGTADVGGTLAEATQLGMGEAVAISAETGASGVRASQAAQKQSVPLYDACMCR